MGLAVNQCVAPAALVVSKPMLGPVNLVFCQESSKFQTIIYQFNRFYSKYNGRICIYIVGTYAYVIRIRKYINRNYIYIIGDYIYVDRNCIYVKEINRYLFRINIYFSGSYINIKEISINPKLLCYDTKTRE